MIAISMVCPGAVIPATTSTPMKTAKAKLEISTHDH